MKNEIVLHRRLSSLLFWAATARCCLCLARSARPPDDYD